MCGNGSFDNAGRS